MPRLPPLTGEDEHPHAACFAGVRARGDVGMAIQTRTNAGPKPATPMVRERSLSRSTHGQRGKRFHASPFVTRSTSDYLSWNDAVFDVPSANVSFT